MRVAFRKRVEDVKLVHRWLGEPVLPETIETWQLVGIGLPTEVGIHFDGKTIVPCAATLPATVPSPT